MIKDLFDDFDISPTNIRIIKPEGYIQNFKLRSFSIKKILLFLKNDGFLSTYYKVKNKLNEKKISEEENLLIIELNVKGDILFCFTRNLGKLYLKNSIIFKSNDNNADVNSIILSKETLETFECFIPVPSCPLEVKDKLIQCILKENKFLNLSDFDITSLLKNKKSTIIVNKKSIKEDEKGCFLLGFGGYVRESIIPSLNLKVFSALDYKAELIKKFFRYSFPIFSEFEEILEQIKKVKKPLVIVSTYHSDHTPMAKEIFNINPNSMIFIEKPPSLTNSEAELLVELINNGAWIDIGFNRRYIRFNHMIKNMLENVNSPIHITMIVKELKLPKNHWYFWPNQGTRIFGNSVHWIDLLRFFIKKEIKNVTVKGYDGNLTITIEFSDNIIGDIILTDIGNDLMGVEEYIEIRWGNTTIKVYDYKKMEIRTGTTIKIYKNLLRDKGHSSMYSDLKNNYIKNQPPKYPKEDITWVTYLCTEIVNQLSQN